MAVDVRAGFWRRWLSRLIDLLVIAVPLQAVVAVLFAVTGGQFQQTMGIDYSWCAQLHALPDGLAPPPPAGSNFARQCEVYFFGFPTANRLQVGRVTKEGTLTKMISQTYILGADNLPIKGFTVDWVVMIAFVVYLLALGTRTGVTLGDKATRIRLVDTSVPDTIGVPFRKVVTRYLAMLIGFVPMLVVVFAFLGLYGPRPEEAFNSQLWTWLWATGAIGMIWIIFLCVQVIRKRDPLYDKIAGTAVVRVVRASTEPSTLD